MSPAGLRAALLIGVVGLCLGPGCAARLLRLENRALTEDNAAMKAQLNALGSLANPDDFATQPDLETVRRWLGRMGLSGIESPSDNVLSVPVRGNNADFRLTLQLFAKERVLFIAATDYFRLEEAGTSRSLVLLLTQIAAMNYDLLLGKFQLNPNSGEISMSVELNLDDGLGYRTFEVATRHLLRTADDRYPVLVAAARGGPN